MLTSSHFLSILYLEGDDCMTDFQKYLDQALKDVEIPSEADEAAVPEYDVFSEISEQLSDARNYIGITQKELAQKTGLTQALISRIESGKSHPTIETLKKLADGLGLRLVVSLENFERGEEE